VFERAATIYMDYLRDAATVELQLEFWLGREGSNHEWRNQNQIDYVKAHWKKRTKRPLASSIA